MKKIFFFLFTVFFSISFQSQIVINELMASNSLAVTDPDFDGTGDWVEFYNTGVADIDLTGWFATDNLSDSMKWMFPPGTTIEAGGFLILWCDGESTGLHTSFKLSSEGEELGLFNASLESQDEVVFEAQDADISWGRTTDGAPLWSWFNESTPGSSNNNSNAYEGVVHHLPYFSKVGGFYTDSFTLSLTSIGGEIRYTLDGTEPTLNSTLYDSPLSILETTFVRGRVFLDNQIPGPTVTHSFFFDPSLSERELPVFSIVTDPDFFWDADIGIYVQDFKPEWEHPLNIEFFENDGNNQAVFNERAGVKINGQNSWELPQKMLGIYFRGGYGSGELDYPLFHDRERTRFDDFVLRAGGSDWSYTLMRDGLAQSLPQKNAYVGYQGFRQSIVFINGEYMGIHNLRSRINEGFLEENYGVETNSYDLISNDGEVEEGSDVDFFLLDDLFGNDLSNQDNFDAVAEVLDLQNFTDYWITEIWSSNGSWGHNVKLWKPNGNGKWRFLFADFDRGFSGSTNDDFQEFTENQNDDYDYARLWLRHMLENPDYSEYFAQRFTDHLHTSFHPIRVNEQIDLFVGRIYEEVAFHVDRWSETTSDYGDGINSVEFWEDEVEDLRTFAIERSPFMVNNLFEEFELDDPVDLATINLPQGAGEVFLNTFKIPGSPWSGPYFKNMPFELTAVPMPGQSFMGWSQTGQQELVSEGAEWKYLDTGEDLGVEWSTSDFDDASWSLGNAELGYGDGDEVTVVSYGSNDNDKHITTYFRKDFIFEGDASVALESLIKLRRDDGAVVYLNGQELFRSNMPNGYIGFNTLASDGVGGGSESDLNEYALTLSLNQGINVLAVEIHQVSSSSSDISFDLSLSVSAVSSEIVSIQNPLTVSLLSDVGYAAHYEPTGACTLPLEFTSDTTLTIECSPYLAVGTTHVLPGAMLTIDPGVEIWFPTDASLIVQGAIQALGTESEPIIFKANEDDGFLSWGHLKMDATTEPNLLKHVIIDGATDGEHPIHDRAALTAWFSDIEIDHAALINNLSNPIYAEHSNVVLTHSIIHSDVTGDLINVKYGTGWIEGCSFFGNSEIDTDAIDYDQVVGGVIRDTEMHSFYGLNSDGIDLGEESENVLIEGCLIHHCTDKGISIGQRSTATIKNNTISQCALGVALKDLGEAVIENVTFYGNPICISAYEKNLGFGGGSISVSRSLLSNSSESPVYSDSLSSVNISECFYDTDTLIGVDVLWENPHFTAPNEFNFTLLEFSPAIGASVDGSDWGTESHLFGGLSDIMISEIGYAGIENANREWIRLFNPRNEDVDISGYTISNGISMVFPENTWLGAEGSLLIVQDLNFFSNTVEQIFQWDSGQLANEGERIILLNASGMVIDHVMYAPESPWPIPVLGMESLQLISPGLDNHFASSWVLANTPPMVVEDLPTPLSIALYPNPTSKTVHVVSNKAFRTLQVFNCMGEMLMSQTFSGQQKFAELDVSNYSVGTYLILVDGSESLRFIRQ